MLYEEDFYPHDDPRCRCGALYRGIDTNHRLTRDGYTCPEELAEHLADRYPKGEPEHDEENAR